MKILVLNSGSSSQKSALFELDASSPSADPVAPVWEARIEWQDDKAALQIHSKNGTIEEQVSAADRKSATGHMLKMLWNGSAAVLPNPSDLEAVGHRVVHGGHKLDSAVRITPEVKRIISSLSAFAPLHNRAELEGIELVEQLAPNAPQIAVFDTGFHSTLPPEAAYYPGPYEWIEAGIRRYGFHGINYEYCVQRASRLLSKQATALRIVACHLGNGCSIAAIAAGKSIDTTMGFTPLEGLMMGTRSGSVDPGILTYLMRQSSITGQELDDLLNRKSGLLGISGLSSDMRTIVSAVKESNARAKLAFNMFVHRLQTGIGEMAAALGGLDVLIFTGGIGENSPEVRAATAAKLGFLGIQLDMNKNAISPADEDISSSQAPVRTLIIRAQEDFAIAQACLRVLGKN
jgi:acetate kinase